MILDQVLCTPLEWRKTQPKVCPRCKELKPRDEFRYRQSMRSMCKPCSREYAREHPGPKGLVCSVRAKGCKATSSRANNHKRCTICRKAVCANCSTAPQSHVAGFLTVALWRACFNCKPACAHPSKKQVRLGVAS